MAELKALIFDVDGTLADTERDGHRIAFNKAFSNAGLDWNWDEKLYHELLAVTGGKERIRFYLDKFLPEFPKPDNFDEFVARLHQDKTAIYVELMEQGIIPLRPGVKRLLLEAREAGVLLAIATTTTPENVTSLITSTLGADAIGWFSVIAAGDIVPAKKPAPDIYFWALEQLKLPAKNCLAFEDSENGILSSQAAGLKTVITVNDYTRYHDFSGAALVISDFGEPGKPFIRLDGEAGNAEIFTLDTARYLLH